jgi:hypothetical protein
LVIGEIACADLVYAKTACVLCGMTMVDLSFKDGDYFDVIMRVGRPMGRGARFRRPR